MSLIIFLFLAFNLIQNTESLQTGFTCEKSIPVACPSSRKIVILDVIYSSECPKPDEEGNSTSIYAPSRCLGYSREQASGQCNGKESCTINNNLEERPEFFLGKQANCAFKGQSINIEYSCIHDFYSSKLPRIDICSLQLLDDIKEGFIHSPNYPNDYSNSLSCTKTVPAPESGHRLKIYAIDLDLTKGKTPAARNNDWLEINENGNRLRMIEDPYTMLFDDVIEASIALKSFTRMTQLTNKKVLLYFIITPVRRPRPSTTTKITTTTTEESVVADDIFPVSIEEKTRAFVVEKRQSNNTGLILLVILLSSVLFVILIGFALYKRRNDRRVRYLTETFHSFFPHRSKSSTNIKLDHNQEKLLAVDVQKTEANLYEFDPVCLNENSSSNQKQGKEEVIYETIPSNVEGGNRSDGNLYSNMYAIPNTNHF